MKRLLLMTLVFCCVACGSDTDKMIYATKGGEFGSQQGNFVADFPTKPKYTLLERQSGTESYEVHTFRSTLGPNKIFTLEYIDYPESTISLFTNEEIYDLSIQNYASQVIENFVLDSQKPIEQHGLKGQYFVLNLNQAALDKGIKGHIEGSIFRSGNRVYTISYTGRLDKNVDTFMESFRILNQN